VDIVKYEQKIYGEREVEDTTMYKHKRSKEDMDLDILPNLRHEKQLVDDLMRAAPQQPSQMRATRTHCRL
jgi:alkylated DNA repair dioxygenase AlkB